MKDRSIPKSDNWRTPPALYDKLNAEFAFDFDPCPYSDGAPIIDGLSPETVWGTSNFVNPPYSRALKEKFIKRSIEEFKKGKLVVLLLPVSTSTAVFHDVILPNKPEIRFLRGRVKFIGKTTTGKDATACGMFDSMVVIFDGRVKNPNTPLDTATKTV